MIITKEVSSPIKNENADEINVWGDFSEVTQQGNYQIIMEGYDSSYPFTIDNEVYKPVLRDLFRMFYLQRCGCEVKKDLAGDFAHPPCHNTLATIYGTERKVDVTGGWHDAGDYGRYIVAAAVTVADLLLAYETNPTVLVQNFHIPESGQAIPDLLSEVRYELDWMLKMQDPQTGGVYHKVTCASFPGFVMPEYETEELIVSPISVTATATFAAAMAMSVRFYSNYDKEFSKKCYDAAIHAWSALESLDMSGGFKNPPGIVTGEYGDSTDIDEKYWAAAELYKLTGDQEYHQYFMNLVKEKVLHGYGWEDVGSFGNAAYMTTSYPVDKDTMATITDSIKGLADILLDRSKKDGYGISLAEEDYKWGSNMVVANNGLHLIDAFHLTNNASYKHAAKEHLHYLLGKNPMAICYVTGHGTVTPIHPHHRQSAAMESPMPGMLVGGPDAGLHDPLVAKELVGMPPAKCYIDHLDSYSTNEITIYWNSPIIYLLAELL
ncbi:MAG TPA: glycoside hydrolase family 9 protein [Lachnospiraceae bacterium]|nr:glycoside hydrolase family 9 protein [Lachnospiraceae bacterium]